ncbi:MAG: GTP-binding protein [Dermabacteraceae bacterium]
MSDAHGPDRSAQKRFVPWDGSPQAVPVGVITAVDPVLRASLTANLLLDVAGAVELRYTVDTDSGALRRLVVGPAGVLEDTEVELDHPCVSCAMREDAVPTLDRLARDPAILAILLVPPISADPSTVVGTLVREQGRWRLSEAVAVLSALDARGDLLGTDTLAERDIQWATEDQRSVGEALAAQIEYAGLIVVDTDPGPDGGSGDGRRIAAGLELVEHLRAPDQLLATSLHEVDASAVLEARIDHDGGLRRRDPRAIDSYGGPTAHGTWTIDLHSERPFHPGRFLENIEALGAGRLRGRGRFWVPDRPGTICQWDGAGGQVSIGASGDSGRDLPTTRMVVTGVDAADAPRVRDAFGRSLLTRQEWERGLTDWLGAEDVLAPWLGEREVAQRRSA